MAEPRVSYRNLYLLADAGRWEELLEFADTAAAAPVTERLEVAHVVALEAPAPIAAAAAELFPDDDRAFQGPLWEVVAHRPWAQLAPHLTNPRTRHLVAQTRVLHGEDLRGAADLSPPHRTAPLALEPWEAAAWDAEWDIPEYTRVGSSGGTIWACPEEKPDPIPLPRTDLKRADHPATAVLATLSDAARSHAFHGNAWEAAAATAVRPDRCRSWPLPFADAYPHLVHLASGERADSQGTGQALGRIALWSALTAMAGLPSTTDPPAVTAFVNRLHCVGWREPTDPIWHLHLAIEDPTQNLTWTLTAHDTP
jgi:hypothetical protein